jgi:tRNA (adenine22-N1)-methyltransferase
MNQKLPKLTPRLKAAYEMCIPGHDVWDICCDHGYLGLNALYRIESPNVYLVDKSNHVVERLEMDLNDVEPSLKVVAKSGQELKVEDLSGTAVIMGVGSQTIIDILSAWIEQKSISEWNLQRLVLSSHTKPERLEDFLNKHDLKVTSKVSIKENRRLREIWRIDFKGY